MFSKIVKSAILFGLLAVTPMAMAANGDYKAGDAEVVKKLPGRDFESAKNANMPFVVYFYDADVRRNDYAKFLETKVLSNAELKDKLKSFLFLKIKHDGTDFKGWPPDWLAKAKNAGAIMVANSDLTQVTFYDKNMPKEAITPQNLVAQMSSVLAWEEKKKAQPGGAVAAGGAGKKEEKEMPVAENKVTVPGLNVDKDGKEKKEPTKPPEKKKAAPADE
jgi:hypothetical protein